jgi:chemotaxis protein CheD
MNLKHYFELTEIGQTFIDAVARNNGRLRTLLGSCVGLALYDRKRRVGGLAHIVLPQSRGQAAPAAKFVDTAVPALFQEMAQLVGGRLELTARIAGGANMFATAMVNTIGLQNIEASERILEQLRIPIVGRHCGGEKGRRMSLDTETGIVTIEMVGFDPITMSDGTNGGRASDGQTRTRR